MRGGGFDISDMTSLCTDTLGLGVQCKWTLERPTITSTERLANSKVRADQVTCSLTVRRKLTGREDIQNTVHQQAKNGGASATDKPGMLRLGQDKLTSR
jgi:hypothetical protein